MVREEYLNQTIMEWAGGTHGHQFRPSAAAALLPLAKTPTTPSDSELGENKLA